MPTLRPILWLVVAPILLISCKRSPAPAAAPPIGTSGVVVSPQTTRLTEPLLPDGSVDYITALNSRASDGVNDDNNAAVLLAAVLPPTQDKADAAARVRDLLHCQTLPPEEQFTSIETAATRLGQAVADSLYKDTDGLPMGVKLGPFARKDHPAVAAWLEINAKALATIEEASHRSHYYVPMIPDEQSEALTLASLDPWITSLRNAAYALEVRAQFRLGTGDIDGFTSDLQTIQRLGALLSTAPNSIAQMVGSDVSAKSASVIGDLLARGALHGPSLAAARTVVSFDLFAFDSQVIDLHERCVLLSSMQYGPRGLFIDSMRPKGRNVIITPPTLDPNIFDDFKIIQWDRAMMAANTFMDRLVTIMQQPTHADFARQRAAFTAECTAAGIPNVDLYALLTGLNPRSWTLDEAPSTEEAVNYLKRRPGESVEDYSARMGTWFARMSDLITSAAELSQGQQMQFATAKVAVALAQYHEDHAAFPDQLADLVPQYLSALPEDWFTAQPLIYRKDGPDVLVYSVGPDGKDGGGKILRTGNGADTGVRVKAP